ncbi:hypothetical protein ANANG_G00211880, partial [Anguilla anguilla]
VLSIPVPVRVLFPCSVPVLVLSCLQPPPSVDSLPGSASWDVRSRPLGGGYCHVPVFLSVFPLLGRQMAALLFCVL